MKAEGKWSRVSWLASVRAEAISSDENGPLVFDPADREPRRSPLAIPEFWIRVPLSTSLDLELGRFGLGWGKTDGFSPADSFLPRDQSDPFADVKLPLWAVRIRGQAGALRVDAVVVPVTTPWRLPPLSGRNAPLPAPFFLVDGENPVPRTGFAALRVMATAGDWDLGAWGRFGMRPAPLLEARINRALPQPGGIAIPADRSWAREEGTGVEISRLAGSFVVRSELAAFFSSEPRLGDALIWTLGFERAFGDGTLLVTFAANARGTPGNPALLFDRAFLPALISIWSRQEEWGSWRLVWTQGTRHGDGLLKAEYTFNADDHLSFTSGVDWVYGSRNGPFGYRPDMRRARMTARYSF